MQYRPSKKFGQHFLTVPALAQRIAEQVELHPGELLLEVGPGRGALTEALLRRFGQLLAVEIDVTLIRHLQEKLGGSPGFRLVHGDFLRINLHQEVRQDGEGRQLVIVGNVPYNISSLILLKLAQNHTLVARAYVMLQREVAQRVAARPHTKDYSFLSVAVQTVSQPKILFTLGPGAFFPKPKVDSAVVALQMENSLSSQIDNINKYLKLVSNAFSQRRKKVVNVLARHYAGWPFKDYFVGQGLNPNSRAENLSPANYVALFKAMRESWQKEKNIK